MTIAFVQRKIEMVQRGMNLFIPPSVCSMSRTLILSEVAH
jgi:hypothetical protein